jgi:hypothetical protein
MVVGRFFGLSFFPGGRFSTTLWEYQMTRATRQLKPITEIRRHRCRDGPTLMNDHGLPYQRASTGREDRSSRFFSCLDFRRLLTPARPSLLRDGGKAESAHRSGEVGRPFCWHFMSPWRRSSKWRVPEAGRIVQLSPVQSDMFLRCL